MPETPPLPAEVGTAAGGFRVLSNVDGNLRIAAWGYWSADVIRAFSADALAAAQVLGPASIFVFDSQDLKPQGAEGQAAIRTLFSGLSRLPFSKGLIIRGNAMTCMQLARLLRECGVEKRIRFADG